MKTLLITLFAGMSLFIPINSLFAQGNDAPWPSGLSGTPYDTWLDVSGDFDPQTAMPTTLVVTHRLLSSGSYVQDTSFVANDLFFSFIVDGLEPNSNYSLRITCTNTYGEYVWDTPFSTTSVGIGEASKEEALTFFPNPVSDELFIEGTRKGDKVEMSNLLGQSFFSGTLQEEKSTIFMGHLPGGIYLVTINGSATKKVVKK